MGARSWCERRSQPPSQSHHHHVRNNQQEAHHHHQYQYLHGAAGAHQHHQHQRHLLQEDLANYNRRLSPPAAGASPSPGPPVVMEYRCKEPLQPLLQPSLQPPSPPPFEPSAMYTASTVKERHRLEVGLLRDRQVRLRSVQTDILLDLPPAIALPDGEEPRAGTGANRHACKVRDAHTTGVGGSLHLIHLRDPEQESEIYRGYIRPPPNRTVLESRVSSPRDALPPYPHPPPPYSGSSGSLAVGLYPHPQQMQMQQPQHPLTPKQTSPPPPPLPPLPPVAIRYETDAHVLRTTETRPDQPHQRRHATAASRKELQSRQGGASITAKYAGSPPSYSQVASAGAIRDFGTKVKNMKFGNRTGSDDDEVRLLSDDGSGCFGVTSPHSRHCYEAFEEYSDSPPSYSDIVGNADADYDDYGGDGGDGGCHAGGDISDDAGETPLIAGRRRHGGDGDGDGDGGDAV